MIGRAAAPSLLVATLLAAGMGLGGAARADDAPDSNDAADAAETVAAPPAEATFPDARFGPRYVIEEVRVVGNRKTERSLIVGELAALGLKPGFSVDASDARVETARYRLLSLGYFLDVRLSVTRGAQRGGVVLVVDVEERGTIVINDIFAATSEATLFWGGADVAETNFLGRGINLGAGFVASTKPLVLDAHAGLGLRLHLGAPPLGGPNGLALSVTGLYNDGSEFYRTSGADSDDDPGRFIANRVRRAGGVLSAGKMLPANLHATLSFREEDLSATLPQTSVPIDFMVKSGVSRVGTVAASLDYDTRSDPVLPRSGTRMYLSVEAGTSILGSSYDYVKGVFDGDFYVKLPHGHALGFHVFAGAIGGDAPYFDRFFVGDLDLLLPRRALGMNFSTEVGTNFLGGSIDHHRYDDYAGRLLIEYAIPIWRRHGLVYGGDAFAAVGIFGMATDGDFLGSGPVTWSSIPIDLTGDLGLRLDTYVGVFTISIANILSRSSF